MITIFKSNQDVEGLVGKAIEEYSEEHSKKATHLVLGRIVYEELRDMLLIGQSHTQAGGFNSYKDLEVVVVEEPAKFISIASAPD